MPIGPVVAEVDDGIWRVRWTDGERSIENVFPCDYRPEVEVIRGPMGAVVLVDQMGQEVGRYNEEWAGQEVSCDEVNDIVVAERARRAGD